MTSALTTLQQWLLFTSTTLVIGCVAWRWRVLPHAAASLAPEASSGHRTLEFRVRTIARAAASVLVLAWMLRMVVQVMGFRDPFVPLWDDVSFLLFEMFWGTVWMGQGAVVLLLCAALGIAGPRKHADDSGRPEGTPIAMGLGWSTAALLVALLAVTISLSGHAVGADAGRTFAVTADALHTLTAGLWIGTLAVILLVGRVQGADGPGLLAAQLRSFSPLALASGVVLVTMGGVLAWTHLQGVSDLWSVPYGRLLSAKVVLAGAIFGLGFWNWRRGLPVMDTEEGADGVRRRAASEVSLAVAVLLLTAVLVHTPKP